MSLKRFNCHLKDSQTAEQFLAIAEVHVPGLEPEAREVLQDMAESLGLKRRDEAAREEGKQYVLQGQLLVLGDARNGKTSLVKATTGGKFDPEENKTKGVESMYVDRKLKTIEQQNMKFGDFARYSKSFVCEQALWPRIFDQGRYRFKSGVVFGQELIFDDSVVNVLRQRCGLDNLGTVLILHLVIYRLILPIILGRIFEESLARWLIFFFFQIKYLYECKTNQKKVSVMILLMLYFGRLGTNFASWTSGFSEDPIPERFNSFLGRLVASGYVPLYVMNPIIFVILSIISSLLTLLAYLILQIVCLNNLPIAWPIQLDFLFDFQDEAHIPLLIFFSRFFFFAPIGLSCSYTAVAFPTECCFIFLLHLMLLHQQNILLKCYTMSALALEVSIIIPLCFIGLHSVVHIILMNTILLCVGAGLHIYGRWLEVKDDFKGKTFTQVFIHKDFVIYSIEIKKALLDAKKLKKALDKAFCKMKIKILDFAGDEEYYAYHQIFLNSNALYAVVFNIQKYLKDNFKNVGSEIRRLRFWLESIHSHVPQGTPIFLVGTHRADIPIETLRVVDSYIRKAVWHSFGDEIVLNKEDDLLFFHVENSRGTTDKGVINLRQNIKSVAKDELKAVFGQEIPLSWIKVQDAIIQYQERQQGPACLTVEDFKKCFEHLYLAWDDEMLKYFHKKGFIIYVDKDQGLSNWVLLNPDVLVQIIILLINRPKEKTNKRGYRKHWLLLEKSGMITKTLLQLVLSQVEEAEIEQSSLIAFLEEYDLLCPLKHPYGNMQEVPEIRQTTHFVPSLLPKAESQMVWHKSSGDVKFYICFDNFLPQALFYRLLSRACKLSYDIMKSYEPVIYGDSGLFWLYEEQPYCLKLLKNEGLIEVTFSETTDGMKPFDIVTLIAGSMVESICKRDFHNLSFHCGPQCTSPTCPGSPSDNMSLFTGQRRRHVFNVYPACKQDRCLDSFKCLNFRQDQQARMWRPQ